MTIYTTYVTMESQSQCDRMKQVCVDNNLPIWEDEKAFTFQKEYPVVSFNYNSDMDEFYIVNPYNGIKWYSHLTKVTESVWLELLKQEKQK